MGFGPEQIALRFQLKVTRFLARNRTSLSPSNSNSSNMPLSPRTSGPLIVVVVTSNAMTDWNLLKMIEYVSAGVASICSARNDASEKVTGPLYVSSYDSAIALPCVRTRPSRTLLPTSNSFISVPSAPSTACFDALTTRELIPPHRPLSEEMARTTEELGFASSSLGERNGIIRSCTDFAKGRAAFIVFSAERSFEAATIFIALVIFAVEVTPFSRFARSFTDGIAAAG